MEGAPLGGLRQRSRRRVVIGLTAASLSVATGIGLWAANRPVVGPAQRPTPGATASVTPATVTHSSSEVPFTLVQLPPGYRQPPDSGMPPGFVAGDTAVLPDGTIVHLAFPAESPLTGWIVPVATLAPDGHTLLYATWPFSHGPGPDPDYRPRVRVHDILTGHDRALTETSLSLSFAVDVQGRIAFDQITGQDLLGEPIGQVTVRSSSGDERWTIEAARWIVAAWAGPHLIVYREEEGEHLTLWVLDGPGEIHPLFATDNANLIAVSPDGTEVFIAEGEGSPVVAVLDVATGSEVARMDVASGSGATPYYGGAWSNDLVVAPSTDGFMVFHVGADGIALVVQANVDGRSLNEPQLVVDDRKVTGWVRMKHGTPAPAICDLSGTTCDVGLRFDGLYRVYDPSRPDV